MVNHGKIARLTRIAVLGAVLYVAQISLAFIPNVEIVTLLIVIFTRNLGKEGIFACFIYVWLNAFSAGFGLWWATYLVVWPLFALMVYKLRKIDSWLIWAVINGAFGLCFGAIFAIPYIFVNSPAFALSYWIGGLTFDVIHCIGNYGIALILGKPVDLAFKRVIANLKIKTE